MRNPIAGVVRASIKLATLPFAILPGTVTRAGSAGADHAGEDTSWLDEVGPAIGEAILDVGDSLEHAVEESFELVGDVVGEGVGLVEDTLGNHRRVWQDDQVDHAQIELRGVSAPGNRKLRRAIQRAIERVDGVRWAEVNAVTRRVAVAFDGSAGTFDALLNAIEGVEEVFDVSRAFDEGEQVGEWDQPERAEHPADAEPVHRSVAAITGGVAALGWTAVGRAARVMRVPVELAGIVSAIDHNPWLRSRLDGVFGHRATATVLPLVEALANGVSQGPIGIMVDLAYQATLLAELRARREVWALREPEFYAKQSSLIDPPDLEPRPVPLSKGPVELWSERISLASFAGFAATLAATRDPRRAADTFLAGTPKAARLGRESFAAQFGRTLAARGVVPLDGSALRRLDRINTVVVDSDVLVTGRVAVGPIVGFPEERAEELRAVAERLLDPDDPTAERNDGRWMLRPFRNDATTVTMPHGAQARAVEQRKAGAQPLALVEDGALVAVVGAVAELEPGADIVVDAVRRSDHHFVIAGNRGGAAARFQPDQRIPRGKKLGAAIRALQDEGAAVLAIGRRGKTGLSAAEVAVGVTRPTGRPPWGADLLFGRELAETAIMIEATTVAARVSERSGHFALGGSGLGALVAFTGPRASAGSRALTMVNGAAAASLLSGMWEAVKLAHRPRPVVLDPTPWHALGVRDVLRALDSSEHGLSAQAALQRQRVQRPDEREVGAFEPFLAELANPLNPVLALGAGASAAIGSMVDAAMVVGLIGINALVGGVQRLRADAAIDTLLSTVAQPITVIRDGQEVVVTTDDLVRGDMIRLQTGDVAPADCRVVDAIDLEVDQATITGESLPVPKDAEPCPDAVVADRGCMMYEGTTVSAGEATVVVVATGRHTEISRSIAEAGPPPKSGVEVRLEDLTRKLLPSIGAAAGVVAGIGLLRRWPLRDVAGTGVSLAVASVPEGLPFVASAAQLAAARRLATRNAVVHNPRTIEALGRVEVLCFDKTGTLTEGTVRLGGISDGQHLADIAQLGSAERDVLAAALRASGSPENGNGGLDYTDQALLACATELSVERTTGVPGWTRVGELPFEASRGVHMVLGHVNGQNMLSVKGAPEAVLGGCVRWRPGGQIAEFDRVAMAEVEQHINDLAARGFRILAVAERDASERTEIDTERLHDLGLVGLIVLADPVRRTAADAVAGVRASGVRPIIMTGDHPNTALAIAEELDMGDGLVVTGSELDALDDDRLADVVAEATVFARVTPGLKVRIVQAIQAQGRAVAMTGDGVNDAAAIRLADVGVALGELATPAARAAADIVVTDNRIETLIDALTEGRALWGSVREALAVLVGGNVGEVAFTGFASLLSRHAPLSPRQFLLVNLLTDLAPALAIAVRPPRDLSPERLLHEGPQRSLGSALTRDMAVRGAATGAGASLAWTLARFTGGRARAGTVGLVALVGTQLGQTMLAGGLREPLVLATGLGSAGVLAAIVQTPGVSHFFGCRPLGPLDWAQALGSATVASVGSQIAERVLTSRAQRS